MLKNMDGSFRILCAIQFKTTNLKAMITCAAIFLGCSCNRTPAEDLTVPLIESDALVAEQVGIVAIEAEHFASQELNDVRAWYITTGQTVPESKPDGDPTQISDASAGAYIDSYLIRGGHTMIFWSAGRTLQMSQERWRF